MPASLHASLMARLDRVPEVREVAQVAACIGREFSYSLLAALSPLPDAELQVALDKLAAAELVFSRGTLPEVSYTFKHALVRDAAHESLLKAQRQQLHGRIVRLLEERVPETVAAEPWHTSRNLENGQRALTGRALSGQAPLSRGRARQLYLLHRHCRDGRLRSALLVTRLRTEFDLVFSLTE